MRLSDIMGRLELSAYPQVALVIFLAVFAVLGARVFARARKGEFERAASLPLHDDADINTAPTPTPTPPGSKP
ncbi:MAG: hypothetical protein ACK5RX_08930 [bacterium]